jgi:toxin-antitoxin system PIN domain toxin
VKLLDVNVWLAAVWQGHADHAVTKRWWEQTDDDLILCRITQMALLRLLSNPAVMKADVLSRRRAWEIIDALLADPRIHLLDEPDGLQPLWRTFSMKDDRSHLLWTEDYLAAFAQAASADLVTLDRGVRARYPSVQVIRVR